MSRYFSIRQLDARKWMIEAPCWRRPEKQASSVHWIQKTNSTKKGLRRKEFGKKEKGRPRLIIRVGNTYIRFRGVIVESKNRLSRISVMLLSHVKTGRTATSLLLCVHCVFRSKCISFCLHFNSFSDGWGYFCFFLRSRCCSQWMQIVFVSCTHIRTIIEAWWNNDPRSAD